MSIRLNTDSPNAWTVEGELTFASVPEIQDDSPARFSSPPATLDLSGVSRIDSAGIALIIEWARRGRAADGNMRLINVPAGMKALVTTTGLRHLLNVQESD